MSKKGDATPTVKRDRRLKGEMDDVFFLVLFFVQENDKYFFSCLLQGQLFLTNQYKLNI